MITASGAPGAAAVLWSIAQVLAGHAYEDVAQHGDEPVLGTNDWSAWFATFLNMTRDGRRQFWR